jgi:serine/alanine adding enzyme
MKVRLFEHEDREPWDRYVMESSGASCYHLIGWKDVIEKTFGHKTYYLLATPDSNNTINPINSKNSSNPSNSIVGILPLVRLKSLLFGNFIISNPYFNYGGICGDNSEIQGLLFNEAIQIARKENAKHIEFRQVSPIIGGLPVKTRKVSMRLELVSTSDDLWKSFSSKLRSQIRRPQKEGMYVKIGREGELDSFYKVFSINMRDLGTPVYSQMFFGHILEEFGEKTWICTTYTKEGKAVASGFIVGFKDILEIPWASSLRHYNHCSPNMLLYWSVLEFGCENGYKFFDFGRSTPGEGTYKFKEQWGAKPVQLYWYYWLPNGGLLPELNPQNPKYKLAINIWRKLPVSLTRWIGPSIVKHLP